jgi:putative transposase
VVYGVTGTDVPREMIRKFAQRVMDADVEVRCGAGYGEVTPDRVNSRNGYRPWKWTPGRDDRAGDPEAAARVVLPGVPGAPPPRRAGAGLGGGHVLPAGMSTRRVEKLAASLGVVGLSKAQVSAMAAELDELADNFRNRPLDVGPYTFVWLEALTRKVCEGGRTVNVRCLIATGVNAAGYREILGIDVTSSEDGAGWLAFLRGLAARGLSGVALVISGDHAGLVNAVAAVLPGAAWQRCRTHYHRNLLTHGAEGRPAVGIDPDPDHLRAARCRLGTRPARPGHRRAAGQAVGRRRAPGRRPRRHPGLHRLPPARSGGRSGPTTRYLTGGHEANSSNSAACW